MVELAVSNKYLKNSERPIEAMGKDRCYIN